MKTFIRFAASLLVAAAVYNVHSQTGSWGLKEITFTPGGSPYGMLYPTISDDGRFVAFSGNVDPVGQNTDHNFELFLYDSVTGITTQLTDTTGFNNYAPFISGDGSKLAFLSNRNENNGNPDGTSEVFLFDLNDETIVQLTNGTVGNNIESIDQTGSTIALYSWDDPTGGNADHNGEIFMLKVATGQFTQVTTSTGNGFLHGGAELDASGDHLIFGSFLNLAGVDPDGKYDVFSYDLTTSTLKQIGELGYQTIPGPISADGTKYFFYSDKYLSANPDGSFEIFVYDSTNGGITMLTDTDAGEYNTQATISNDGTKMSFLSSHDWTGGNADHNMEIYVMDLTTGAKTQITDTQGYEIRYPAISGDGQKIVFSSNLFAELGNADGGWDIFLAEYVPPPSSDLGIGLAVDKINAKQGDKVTYTITLQNFGPDDAENVLVNNLISSSATFVSASSNNGSFTTPAVGQSGTVTWNVGTLADSSQANAQIQVTVILKGKGTITNTASATSSTSDPNASNNSAAITINVGSGGGGRK